jgi:hypothetical protein
VEQDSSFEQQDLVVLLRRESSIKVVSATIVIGSQSSWAATSLNPIQRDRERESEELLAIR